MAMNDIELDDVNAFVRIAERGSVTGAALAMGVTKSTVSRRIQRLEAALGLPLLARTPNSVRLTDYGEMFRERCGPALAEVDAAALMLRGMKGEPTGLLRITMPEGLGNAAAVTAIMLDFQRAHPRVEIEVFATHRMFDLVEHNIDIAIRPVRGAIGGHDSGLRSHSLGEVLTPLYARPDADPPGTLSEAVERIHVIHTGLVGGTLNFVSARGSIRQVTLTPRFRTNSFGQILHATLEGASIGLLPRFQAAPWVDTGQLVRVCPQWAVSAGVLALVWPASRHLSPRLRAFIDFFSERAVSSELVSASAR